MLKADIKVGKDYALREKRGRGQPFQRVRVLEHVRGNKWKAEWVDPNPGLVDYVESGWLVVPWKERGAFLRDEEREEAIDRRLTEIGFKDQSALDTAVEQVFESVGETDLFFFRGKLTGPPEAVARVRARAGVPKAAEAYPSYIDRHGTLHMPFDQVMELAQHFATAEPSTVLVGAEAGERKWASDAQRPGGEYLVSLLNEYRAGWAILRQWAGHDAAVAQREEEIKKLERLVWDAVYALQKAGVDDVAARLRRAMERR